MSTPQQQLSYIERYLIYDVCKSFGAGTELVNQSVDCSTGLDGFMSALYTVVLELNKSGRKETETVLVKFMKGSKQFRQDSQSYIEFANEVFAYAEILPAYEHLLRSSKLATDIVSEWVPYAYRAQFGVIEGLSTESENESLLALKHLKNDGYELGPRCFLQRQQLEAMCVLIGQYHALGHALRVVQPQVYDRLKAGIVPLHFAPTDATGKANVFQVLYKVAFARFFDFYDRKGDELVNQKDREFVESLCRLRDKYFTQPEQLLELIRTRSCDTKEADSYFSTFLHGDFNRNNVLFHYDSAGTLDGIKMIDFQELRFSTVAMDLSFFLYMNCPAAEREACFHDLLKKYHQAMFEKLELVLQRNRETLSEEQLERVLADYSYERFEAHFKRYAFYGALVCMHFMPWVLSTEEECAKLSMLFESDMHSSAFYDMSLTIGGDECNYEIFKVVHHAFQQGYLDGILN